MAWISWFRPPLQYGRPAVAGGSGPTTAAIIADGAGSDHWFIARKLLRPGCEIPDPAAQAPSVIDTRFCPIGISNHRLGILCGVMTQHCGRGRETKRTKRPERLCWRVIDESGIDLMVLGVGYGPSSRTGMCALLHAIHAREGG